MIWTLTHFGRALDKELQHWSSGRTTPEPDEEEYYREMQLQEDEAYRLLCSDGGRPSHKPIARGELDLSGDNADIVSYWLQAAFDQQFMLKTQLDRWQKFRGLQDEIRKPTELTESFDKICLSIHHYRQKRGFKGRISMLQDRTKQSRLADWQEFQYLEHRRADRLRRSLELAEKRLKRYEEELQVMIAQGRPESEIEWMKNETVAWGKGRRGTVRRDLERHAVLLKWIDEQIPLIASESTASCSQLVALDHESCPPSTHSRKRKQPSEDTVISTENPFDISRPKRKRMDSKNAHSAPSPAPVGALHSEIGHASSLESRLQSSKRTKLSPNKEVAGLSLSTHGLGNRPGKGPQKRRQKPTVELEQSIVYAANTITHPRYALRSTGHGRKYLSNARKPKPKARALTTPQRGNGGDTQGEPGAGTSNVCLRRSSRIAARRRREPL